MCPYPVIFLVIKLALLTSANDTLYQTECRKVPPIKPLKVSITDYIIWATLEHSSQNTVMGCGSLHFDYDAHVVTAFSRDWTVNFSYAESEEVYLPPGRRVYQQRKEWVMIYNCDLMNNVKVDQLVVASTEKNLEKAKVQEMVLFWLQFMDLLLPVDDFAFLEGACVTPVPKTVLELYWHYFGLGVCVLVAFGSRLMFIIKNY